MQCGSKAAWLCCGECPCWERGEDRPGGSEAAVRSAAWRRADRPVRLVWSEFWGEGKEVKSEQQPSAQPGTSYVSKYELFPF